MCAKLPDEVIAAWQDREGPVVLTTVNCEGVPNSIYASVVSMTADGRIAVADNYFDKTIANIREGRKAGILFITKKFKSYQIKGGIEYCSNGPLFDEMLLWADPKHPRKGVAVLNTEDVYQGKDKLI